MSLQSIPSSLSSAAKFQQQLTTQVGGVAKKGMRTCRWVIICQFCFHCSRDHQHKVVARLGGYAKKQIRGARNCSAALSTRRPSRPGLIVAYSSPTKGAKIRTLNGGGYNRYSAGMLSHQAGQGP